MGMWRPPKPTVSFSPLAAVYSGNAEEDSDYERLALPAIAFAPPIVIGQSLPSVKELKSGNYDHPPEESSHSASTCRAVE